MAYIKTPDYYCTKSDCMNIAEFVERQLENSHDQEQRVQSLISYCGQLTDLLVDKGVISVEEVGMLFGLSVKRG